MNVLIVFRTGGICEAKLESEAEEYALEELSLLNRATYVILPETFAFSDSVTAQARALAADMYSGTRWEDSPHYHTLCRLLDAMEG